MMKKLKLIGAVASLAMLLCASLFAVNGASAAITTFAGGDSGVGPGGLRPLSDGAAASFDLAAGGSTLIDFESVPLGNTGSFTAAPGVSATYGGNDNGGGIVTTAGLFGGSDPTHLAPRNHSRSRSPRRSPVLALTLPAPRAAFPARCILSSMTVPRTTCPPLKT
jgi:hypothetical protein